MFLIIISIVIVLAWLYCFWLREFLVAHWPDKFGWWHDIEDTLYAKSRTILVARLYWVGAIVIAIHDMAASAGLDWTPITQQLGAIIPEQYRPLALAGLLFSTGLLIELLRRITTSAIGEKS